MNFFDLIVAQADATARIETQKNNASRLAWSAHKVQSSGFGTVRQAVPIDFDLTFLEEPVFTQGASIVVSPSGALDPVGSAGVWQWHRNPKGHYVGAYIYLSVVPSEIDSVVKGVQMTHHLLFMGMGYKDLGQAVTTDAQLLAPRTVGFGV